jgi:hypothetical protein
MGCPLLHCPWPRLRRLAAEGMSACGYTNVAKPSPCRRRLNVPSDPASNVINNLGGRCLQGAPQNAQVVPATYFPWRPPLLPY